MPKLIVYNLHVYMCVPGVIPVICWYNPIAMMEFDNRCFRIEICSSAGVYTYLME